MSDTYHGETSYSRLLQDEDTRYLAQGNHGDQITMSRDWKNLLEPERENAQLMAAEKEVESQ